MVHIIINRTVPIAKITIDGDVTKKTSIQYTS